MEDITDADYKHAKRTWEDIMIYKYHDLYLQRKYIITGMYIWKLLQQMHGDVWTWSCILFAPAPRLAWPKCHVKTEVELELLPDVDMPLTIEKGIRDRVWHAIGMQKATTILCLQIQIQRLTQWKLNKFMEDKSNIVISAQICKTSIQTVNISEMFKEQSAVFANTY